MTAIKLQTRESGKHTATIGEGSILLDGEPLAVTIVALSRYSYTLTLGGSTYKIVLLKEDALTGALTLSVNGKRITLTALTRMQELRALLTSNRPATARAADLNAPMPGLIRAVRIVPGQEVAAGELLLVLEAMKMENNLKSPSTGRVAEVAVTEGQAVEKGQLLVRFS